MADDPQVVIAKALHCATGPRPRGHESVHFRGSDQMPVPGSFAGAAALVVGALAEAGYAIVSDTDAKERLR